MEYNVAMASPFLCTGPPHRREFLRAGALALGGLTLPQVLAGRAAAGTESLKTSVILLYLSGGASHLETYDLKQDAPSSDRSVFASIPTVVPGMDVCELLPLHAKVADKFSLVRSLHHDIGIHSDGGILILTGKRPTVPDPLSLSKSEHPDFGSIASKFRGLTHAGRAIPPYVGIPSGPYMTRPTYLGAQHGVLNVGDPSTPNYAPPNLRLHGLLQNGRLEERQSLLARFDTFRRDLDLNGAATAGDRFQESAFELLTSSSVAEAFDLSKEPDDLRERYGRNVWGQGCLLARRLAEAGTSVISVTINTPKNGPEFTNWDDHILNANRPGHFAHYMRTRLPYYDQALATLIDDVFTRGREREIMIVAVGEFGRTPRLSSNASGTGRDHWPQAYTALVSGGGLKMGQVVGATNSKGEYPTEQPHTPQDLLATIYRHLGIDHHRTLTDFSGRPVHLLAEGELIGGLL